MGVRATTHIRTKLRPKFQLHGSIEYQGDLGHLIGFLCGPLCIFAASASKMTIKTQRKPSYTEDRREDSSQNSLLVQSRLVFHAICKHHATILQFLALNQLEIDLFLHFMKQRDSGAKQNRMNVESDLVD